MNEQKFIEVIDQIKEKSPKRKFVESIDMAINIRDVSLNDPSKRFQIDVLLPHPMGKEVKICVLGEGAQLVEAESAGAAKVIDKNELENISRDPKQAKKLAQNYDFFIASAPLMPIIGRSLGKFLGPRGKMPRPVPPAASLEPIISNYRRTVKLRLRQSPVIHMRIGTINMETKLLAENAMTILRSVEGRLDKGENNIRSLYIKTTMGPTVRINK